MFSFVRLWRRIMTRNLRKVPPSDPTAARAGKFGGTPDAQRPARPTSMRFTSLSCTVPRWAAKMPGSSLPRQWHAESSASGP